MRLVELLGKLVRLQPAVVQLARHRLLELISNLRAKWGRSGGAPHARAISRHRPLLTLLSFFVNPSSEACAW